MHSLTAYESGWNFTQSNDIQLYPLTWVMCQTDVATDRARAGYSSLKCQVYEESE